MADFEIPDRLLPMLRSRRVIPFIGAGFSSSMGLPNWEDLLKVIAKEIRDPTPFDEIKHQCGNDHLQIAEYYLLKCDGKIGPLRNAISKCMNVSGSTVLSGSHVELVNLGQQQIYTTNYDEFIERTFDALSIQNQVVVIPKDIALSDSNNTQIVKYHGDLKHEETLVLTESKYYTRLEFESPLDLKFRSDILGKSVLFIGYSFRDINIRIIWYKLMKMMEEIPPSDRPNSYIVRFDKNQALEKLYDSVGIKSIVLDPESVAKTQDEKSELLSEFLYDLSTKLNNGGSARTPDFIPGTTIKMSVSTALINKIDKSMKKSKAANAKNKFMPLQRSFAPLFKSMSARRIPQEITPHLNKLLDSWTYLSGQLNEDLACDFIYNYKAQIGYNEYTHFMIANIFLLASRTALDDERSSLKPADIDWPRLYSTGMTEGHVKHIVIRLEKEITFHQGGQADFDLAYIVDCLQKLVLISESPDNSFVLGDQKEKIAALLETASSLYPSIKDHNPSLDSIPDVDEICDEIAQKNKLNEAETDDPPF
jgi:hypothetical protein